MNNHNCCLCYRPFYLCDHVELKPCECVTCPKCLLQSHAVRGTLLLSCHGCGTTLKFHECVNVVEENEGHGDGSVAGNCCIVQQAIWVVKRFMQLLRIQIIMLPSMMVMIPSCSFPGSNRGLNKGTKQL